MIFLMFFGPLILTSLVTMLMGNFFVLAGIERKKSLIPFLNVYLWFKILQRSPTWGIFFFIPFINIVLIIWLVTEFLKCYGKVDLGSQVLGIFFGFIYLPVLNFTNPGKYLGKFEVLRSGGREWIDALLFAVVAATIIRTFIFEAYTIPTSSMEKTLLVGDYLFVSKFHYGPRLPETPLSVPFVHNTMPIGTGKSYSDLIKLPFYRFPGLETVHRNDIVVFNYPVEDFRPVDKRENYIKRCVGVPGDTIKVVDRILYINNAPAFVPTNHQYSYAIGTKSGGMIGQNTFDKLNITDVYGDKVMMTDENVNKVKHLSYIDTVFAIKGEANERDPNCFPHDSSFHWNQDFYGPLAIPAKGTVIKLTKENIAIYERIITVYEHNTLAYNNGSFVINGQQTNEYTIKMNYYWMMGDNRHNSLDSRFWGFVPEDHIVGKAWFIWMSSGKEGIRWDRIFTYIPGMK